MGILLNDIAKTLKDKAKVQLIYAFNGTGKTRLSKEFKLLVEPEIEDGTEREKVKIVNKKIIYYNALTEDLFYWNNEEPKIKIQPNEFTKWILEEQGKEDSIAENFKKYSGSALTPRFNSDYSEVSFSFKRGNSEIIPNAKISKGEESNFIWCIFYEFLKVFILEFEEGIEDTQGIEAKKYVFIDDPVTSLDDNHLIQLAVDLAQLIKESIKTNIEFIITTHNPLFYNIMASEFSRKDKVVGYDPKTFKKHRLSKLEDETFLLDEQTKDSHFSYHLFLKSEIEKAVASGDLRKYHFNFLRNILEKTATFLGYEKSVELFPKVNDQPDPFVNRIVNHYSHSKHSGDEVAELSINEKEELKRIFEYLISNYKFR